MLVEGLDTMVNQPEEKQFTENRKASATLLTCSGGGLLSLALSSVSLSLSGEGKERSGSVPKTSKGKVVPRRDSLLILLDPKNMQSNTKSCLALLLTLHYFDLPGKHLSTLEKRSCVIVCFNLRLYIYSS
jgi:hypothetical protein